MSGSIPMNPYVPSVPLVSIEGLTPFLIATVLCGPLWAINVSQCAVYFRTYPKDRPFLKILVGSSIFFNTAQLAILAYTVYFWVITCRYPSMYPYLGTLKRSMVPSYLTYFLTTVVQCFYAMRVWYVSKSRVTVFAIVFLSTVQMITGFALCTHMVIKNDIASVQSRFNHISGGIELVSSMICDMLISASLIWHLRGKRGPFKATRTAINKIILYMINIGILTNLLALANLATWLGDQKDFTWAIFHFALGKIYVNSMLVSLNAREGLRKAMSAGTYIAAETYFDDATDRSAQD